MVHGRALRSIVPSRFGRIAVTCSVVQALTQLASRAGEKTLMLAVS